MQLKKTKLAGIISLLLCSTASAAVAVDVIVEQPNNSSRFGPYVSAMDTSSAAASTVTYTNTYAQPFSYDIGAPWSYNKYCEYDSDVCEMYWEGTKPGGTDGLYIWRNNITNTYNANYNSESDIAIQGNDSGTTAAAESITVTAINTAGQKIGNITDGASFTRRGFYEGSELTATDFTGSGDDNGGFSSVYDFTDVSVGTFVNTVIVGQSSVAWSNNASSFERFNACFNAAVDDDRYDYDDLYYCPGFNLQASYWLSDDTDNVKTFTDTWINGLVGHESDATYIANAYAINTSGFAVGFSTQNIYSDASGGRARAAIFTPKVESSTELSFTMAEITKPKTDAGSDYNDVIRDTVAIDITDTVYDAAAKEFKTADGTTTTQAFIAVGNRTFQAIENRSKVTDFYTYDVLNGTVRYPFSADPVKGASSQVSKISNDGLAVGWRDARGETSPTVDGSPRFQSAFVYDYKSEKSAYLDDLYCAGIDDNDVKYRFANAISISDQNADGDVVVVANAFDYGNLDNYKNRVGSKPVVLKMTIPKTEWENLSSISQCPIKAEEDYERSGAGMGWFILLPTMMLLFRRFKR